MHYGVALDSVYVAIHCSNRSVLAACIVLSGTALCGGALTMRETHTSGSGERRRAHEVDVDLPRGLATLVYCVNHQRLTTPAI